MIQNGKTLPEADLRFGGIVALIERVLARVFGRSARRPDKTLDGMDERMARYRDRMDS